MMRPDENTSACERISQRHCLVETGRVYQISPHQVSEVDEMQMFQTGFLSGVTRLKIGWCVSY
jgi:hypothetical protein